MMKVLGFLSAIAVTAFANDADLATFCGRVSDGDAISFTESSGDLQPFVELAAAVADVLGVHTQEGRVANRVKTLEVDPNCPTFLSSPTIGDCDFQTATGGSCTGHTAMDTIMLQYAVNTCAEVSGNAPAPPAVQGDLRHRRAEAESSTEAEAESSDGCPTDADATTLDENKVGATVAVQQAFEDLANSWCAAFVWMNPTVSDSCVNDNAAVKVELNALGLVDKLEAEGFTGELYCEAGLQVFADMYLCEVPLVNGLCANTCNSCHDQKETTNQPGSEQCKAVMPVYAIYKAAYDAIPTADQSAYGMSALEKKIGTFVPSTESAEAIKAGATSIDIGSLFGFTPGMKIYIGAGTAFAEYATILGFGTADTSSDGLRSRREDSSGTVNLKAPLTNAHSAGAAISGVVASEDTQSAVRRAATSILTAAGLSNTEVRDVVQQLDGRMASILNGVATDETGLPNSMDEFLASPDAIQVFQSAGLNPGSIAAIAVSAKSNAPPNGGDGANTKNNFVINPDCGQVGLAPAGLADSLLSSVDYACYEPSKWPEKYSMEGGLPANLFGDPIGDDEAYEYIFDIVSNRVAPILGFGIIAFIWLSCWSCCSCMKCCCCCQKRMDLCSDSRKDEWIITMIGTGLAAVVMIVAFYGWGLNAVQNDSITAFGDSFDDLEGWAAAAETEMQTASASYGELSDTNAKLQTAIAGTSYATFAPPAWIVATGNPAAAFWPKFEATIVAGDEGMALMVEDITAMKANLGDLGDLVVGTLANVNGPRNIGVLLVWITLAGLCFFTLVNIWVAMCCSKVRRKGPIKCCFGACTFLMVIILLILSLVCSMLYLATTILGDFCMAPDETMSNALNSVEPNSTFAYYLTCDTDSDVSPFKGVTDLSMAAVESGVQEMTAFVDYLEATKSAPNINQGNYATVHPLAVDTLANLVVVQAALGGGGGDKLSKGCNDPITGSDDGLFGNPEYCQFGTEQANGQGYTDGAFSTISCYAANSRYQGFVNALCGDFYGTLARMFELFIVAGVFMILMEVARRLTRAEADAGDDDEDWDEKAAGEMEYGEESATTNNPTFDQEDDGGLDAFDPDDATPSVVWG